MYKIVLCRSVSPYIRIYQSGYLFHQCKLHHGTIYKYTYTYIQKHTKERQATPEAVKVIFLYNLSLPFTDETTMA